MPELTLSLGRLPRLIGRHVLGLPTARVRLMALRLTDRRAGLAVTYHRVGDPAGDPRTELVPALGSRLFRRQVRHLARAYTIVAASELPAAVAARRRGQRFPIAITFDDDLASHHTVAAPILTACDAHASFFLCGASLTRPHRFWWECLQDLGSAGIQADLSPHIPAGAAPGVRAAARAIEALHPEARRAVAARLEVLAGPPPPEAGASAQAVRSLVADGFAVGFHTLRHDPLTTLDAPAVAAAMTDGRQALEEIAGPLTMISYPHGAADDAVAVAAAEAGFVVGFTNTPGAVQVGTPPLLLPRVTPSHRSAGQLALQLVRELEAAGQP